MLIQFRFQNFLSFRDDTILDFSATKITEHGEHVVTIGKEKLLPVAAIFGANASGKTNALSALTFMAFYVTKSFQFGSKAKDHQEDNDGRPMLPPFLFCPASREAATTFEVYFTIGKENNGRVYNYGFVLDRNGVVEEWLNIKAKTAKEARKVFYRSGPTCDLSGLPPKMQENIKLSLGPETLIVSLGAILRIGVLKAVYDWFYDCNFTDFGDPDINATLSRQLPPRFWEKSVQVQVVNYLSSFDPSIIDFEVERNEKEKYVKVNAIHRTSDGGTIALPLEQESSGTLKMLTLYPFLKNTLRDGSVLVVDELNARLHPLLVRSFLLTFLDPNINKNHAQLIFTTHDAWQLSNDLLRRDEIWFTEKDGDGASTLYSLADFQNEDGDKIRKDENYEKNYLLGKYGAIPTLKCFDILGEG